MEEVQVSPAYFHTSVLNFCRKIGYILQLIEPVLNGSVSSFSVKAAPTDAYNVKLQERLSRSVFVHCSSWARTNGTGKAFNPFPWAVTWWWWWLRKPNWAHFVAVGAEKWVWAGRIKAVKRCITVLLLSWLCIRGSSRRILHNVAVSISLFSMLFLEQPLSLL